MDASPPTPDPNPERGIPAGAHRERPLLASQRSRVVSLVLVLLVAAVLRGIFLHQVERTPDFAHLAVDAQGYDVQARGVLAGTWPGDQVFYQDALYPFFLAGHYRLLGDRPEDVFRTQLVLGVATAGLAFLLASLLFGPIEGLLAGLLAASFGPSFFYETLLLKATLTLFVLTACLLALSGARRRDSLPLFLFSGLLFGAAALLRGNLLALIPLAALWVFLFPAGGDASKGEQRPPKSHGLLRAALLFAGAALAIAPVTLHNLRSGDFVLITSQAGQNFYIGNNPFNTTGSYAAPPGVRGIQTFEQVDFARIAEREAGHALSPSERSAFWFQRSFAFLREQPGTAARLLLKKCLLFVNHLEVPDNADYETTASEVPLLRLPLPTFSFLFVLAAAALALVRWNRELLFLAASGATIGLTVIAFYVFSRYRLSIVPILLVFASAAPRALVLRFREQAFGRILAALVLAALALFVTSREVWSGSRSMLHYNRALYEIEDANPSGAEVHLEHALEIDPCNWYALLLRAQLETESGRIEEARSDFDRAIDCAPGAAEPHYKLGLFLLAKGDLAAARGAFQDAIAAEPYDVAVVKLAETESRLGMADRARKRLDALLERRPRYVPALTLAARLARQAGDAARADELLERNRR